MLSPQTSERKDYTLRLQFNEKPSIPRTAHYALHIMLWTLHLVPHKKRIKLLANPVSHVNLLHCLNF